MSCDAGPGSSSLASRVGPSRKRRPAPAPAEPSPASQDTRDPDTLRADIEKLAAENIQPLKVYFSGDDWQESASFVPSTSKSRRIFATFTYREGEQCNYGVAEILQTFDFMKAEYGEPEINIQKGLPIGCAEAN